MINPNGQVVALLLAIFTKCYNQAHAQSYVTVWDPGKNRVGEFSSRVPLSLDSLVRDSAMEALVTRKIPYLVCISSSAISEDLPADFNYCSRLPTPDTLYSFFDEFHGFTLENPEGQIDTTCGSWIHYSNLPDGTWGIMQRENQSIRLLYQKGVRNGRTHGPYIANTKYYSENSFYSNGLPVGARRKFDENGRITHQLEFDSCGFITSSIIYNRPGGISSLYDSEILTTIRYYKSGELAHISQRTDKYIQFGPEIVFSENGAILKYDYHGPIGP